MVSIENFDNKFRKIGRTKEWKQLQEKFNEAEHIFLFGHGGNLGVADHAAIDMSRLTNKNVIAPKPTLIENKKVVAEEPVVTKVVATEVSAASAKGRLRQVVESEKVEKVVSYFSSYAPTLLSFYLLFPVYR